MVIMFLTTFPHCESLNFHTVPKLTIWKFQYFYITQILHEINFGEIRSAKIAVFAILGALNFVNLVNYSIQKVQKFLKIKIQSL